MAKLKHCIDKVHQVDRGLAALLRGLVHIERDDPNQQLRFIWVELVTVNIKGSGTKTIVVDSLTPIIAPLTTKAFRDNKAGQNRKNVTSYAEKATAVRLIQDSLIRSGDGRQGEGGARYLPQPRRSHSLP